MRKQPPRRFQRNWRRRTMPPLYPWMKLAGRWIEHAGFTPGQRVRISVEHGRLTITAD
ncbi:SymE family type I addiction module toxin [Paraburkholderia rhizosphaerae]|uniref:SymE family type I addiction module toxin n=1 Tax=Paraburkholderia rhizosphaerae TaxID=480658 RepID=UPI001FB8A003|nr:SymE family type I addiction module toxin [Paraburkholderia rhizosphaerae]